MKFIMKFIINQIINKIINQIIYNLTIIEKIYDLISFKCQIFYQNHIIKYFIISLLTNYLKSS